MRISGTYLTLVLSLFFMGISAIGCSGSKSSSAQYDAQMHANSIRAEQMMLAESRRMASESGNARMRESANISNTVQPTSERLIIYNANVRMGVDLPDSASVKIAALAQEFGGYVQESGNTTITLRVQADLLHDALEKITAFGIIDQKNIRGQDVTDQYSDLGIRLENALRSRARYLELLDRAENVSEALQVERELERLNGVIDQLKGQMNRLENLTALATIQVSLYKITEPEPERELRPGILGYVGLGIYRGVRWLFVRG
ncbi:MAG: DUF4349 domain-containing protein [Balneolales bacterium]|nr:DUF4349 domain-containing protein [Balneolales bacterium]